MPDPAGAQGDSSDDFLNLKQVAAALGVHYMTAYRYVRQGRLEAARDGTEWRIRRSALEAFRTGTSPDAALDSPNDGATQWHRRMESCLIAGDEVAAWGVVEMALAAGHSPTDCYVDILSVALTSISERWVDGALDVADRHIATAVAVRVVSRLGARFRRPGRSRGAVVFGAPQGELHSLPVSIASDLMRLSGFDVLELGANVPAEAFVSAVQRTPRLVCVGIDVTKAELLAPAQHVIDAIRAIDDGVPIVLGGLVANAPDRKLLRGVTAIAGDEREAVAIVDSLSSRRSDRRLL